jgi:CysZ protein
MLDRALSRTMEQMSHPTFRKVFFLGTLAATLVLFLTLFGMWEFWPAGTFTGWDWLDDILMEWELLAKFAVYAPVAVLGTYFLFPPLAVTAMGLLLDQVIDAVEEEYYPDRPAVRKVSVWETVLMALKQGSVVLLVNLLAMPLYILFFFISGGILSLGLYLIINGYLFGREYFEMVAIRFMPRSECRKLRASRHSKAVMGGMVIAGLFLIPFANLIAPLFGAALMTHLVHHTLNHHLPD